MKKIFLLSVVAFFTISSAACAADNIFLPVPQKDGGKGVFAAIAGRASAKQSDFEKKDITDAQLSAILWAATGKNRPDKGWTIPLAQGMKPYVDVYVLRKDGAYQYYWEKGMLALIVKKNMIGLAGGQNFIETAPCVLVFVASGSLRVASWADVAAGAMSQNVYLAAESLGLKTRFVQNFNQASLTNYLNLSPLNRVLCIMPIGYQK